MVLGNGQPPPSQASQTILTIDDVLDIEKYSTEPPEGLEVDYANQSLIPDDEHHINIAASRRFSYIRPDADVDRKEAKNQEIHTA